MTYRIATGHSRTETHWHNTSLEWPVLVERLSKTHRTAETLAAYRAMSKEARSITKDIGGFVGGALVSDGRRNAQTIASRSLVTLDIDYGEQDTVGVVADALAGNAWVLYSTHSHTKEAPRYRLVIPLSRELRPDEYAPVARRVAEAIGIDTFDDSTFESHRLMYWPSTCADGDYVFKEGKGDPLDPDPLLASYADWRNPVEYPVSGRVARLMTPRGTKQADPTEKKGVIGAFCRAYTVTEAIRTFLSDIYAPTSQEGRWTYKPGSSAGGLVVYEDKWAYSHHGTDPAGEKLCNAFDLVRLHLYGDLDADSMPETPVNRLPSYRAMEELAQGDDKVRALWVKSNLDPVAAFSEVDYEAPAPDDWTKDLELDRMGRPKAVPQNFALILRNDPQLRGRVKYDEFHDRLTVTGALPWREHTGAEDEWSEKVDDGGLQEYISRVYHVAGKQMLMDMTDLVFHSHKFHPVRDYLSSLPEWDGAPRVDTLLVDYLGAEDNALTRAMTRKHLVAAVRRILHPGCKYDYILTLVGREGLGKSTLFRKLGGEWFTDSFSPGDIGSKEAMDQVRGIWLAEMAELKDYKRGTNEAFKAFITKEEDRFRPAYGRRTLTYKRQLVFCASTNETNFLKGFTGNRRFWPVPVGVDLPEKSVFTDLTPEVRDQIWAEALRREKDGETLFLEGVLEAQARERQSEHNEVDADPRLGVIASAIRQPLPANWKTLTREDRIAYYKNGAHTDTSLGDCYFREYISAIEVQVEILQEKPDAYRAREITAILERIPGLTFVGLKQIRSDVAYGIQRRFRIEPKTEDEGGNRLVTDTRGSVTT